MAFWGSKEDMDGREYRAEQDRVDRIKQQRRIEDDRIHRLIREETAASEEEKYERWKARRRG